MSKDTIKWLSNAEGDLLGAMIRDLKPARVSVIPKRSYHTSSIGDFDHVPNEVVTMIISHLDLRSLARFSQVCFGAREFIDYVRTYHKLLRHVPEALTALGKTGLLKYYSPEQLEEVLRSDKCVSCYAYGGFLLLPTLERACYCCLDRNSALRVMKIADAKSVFGLSDDHLEQLPVMMSLPGKYMTSHKNDKKRSFRLVNVKQAKQLALDIHGSMEQIQTLTVPYDILKARRRHITQLALFNAPLEPPGIDMSRLPHQRYLLEDLFGGMASIRFPSLTNNKLDYGYLCRGCALTYDHHQKDILPPSIATALLESTSPDYDSLRAAMSHLHSLEGFKEHVLTCYGAQWLLAEGEPCDTQPDQTPESGDDESE